MNLPVLYSFRRCPYAIRTRMVLAYAGIALQIREVKLSDKPQALLNVSPKATVPVLVLSNNKIIDESLDIIDWALKISDPDKWLISHDEAEQLIKTNDGEFKTDLDHYKYAERFPEQSELYYRQRGERFIKQLETQLTRHAFLMGNTESYIDVAIFPFIRQFASVDLTWFEGSEYQHTIKWLNYWKQSAKFLTVMAKLKPWQEGD